MSAFAGGAGDAKFVPSGAAAFKRGASNFQNWISNEDGSEYPPETGRYHLFVNYTCGWCHRVLILRQLKGLADVVSISFTEARYVRDAEDQYCGWGIENDEVGSFVPAGSNKTPLPGFNNTYEVYNRSKPGYGRKQLSVPILFDKWTQRVVSNDNVQIAYILNSAFDNILEKVAEASPGHPASLHVDFNPVPLQAEIAELNDLIYPNINDGVYRVAFAGDEPTRLAAKQNLFNALERLEQILLESEAKLQTMHPQGSSTGTATASPNKFTTTFATLCNGDPSCLTLADIRAFPHLFRFDTCYYTAFGCDVATLQGGRYPAICRWVEAMYALPGISSTCNLYSATLGYHRAHGDTSAADKAFSEHKWPFLK